MVISAPCGCVRIVSFFVPTHEVHTATPTASQMDKRFMTPNLPYPPTLGNQILRHSDSFIILPRDDGVHLFTKCISALVLNKQHNHFPS